MTPQSSVQTTPGTLDGVEIRTVSGPVINEINVICPKTCLQMLVLLWNRGMTW